MNLFKPQALRAGLFPDDVPPVGTLTFEVGDQELTFEVTREMLGYLKVACVELEAALDRLERKQ